MRTLVIGHGPDADNLKSIALRNGLECRCISPSDAESPDFTGYGAADIVLLCIAQDWGAPSRILGDLRCARESTAVVGVGPTDQPKRILQLLREGLAEYLDVNDVDNELDAAFARLKKGRDDYSRRARVVGVLGASGGSGTSVIAANLATLNALRGEETMLLDARTSGGDQTALFDVRPRHSLVDVCQHVDRLDHLMLRQSLTRHGSGVNILAAPPANSDYAAVTARSVRHVMSTASAVFRHVVVDLERGLTQQQQAIVGMADVLLLIVRLDVLSLRNAANTLTRLDQNGVNADQVKVVVNRYGQRGDMALKFGSELLGVEFLGRIPNDPGRVGNSINRGAPVVLQHRRSGIARALVTLARQIDGLQPQLDRHADPTTTDTCSRNTAVIDDRSRKSNGTVDETPELSTGLLRVNGHTRKGSHDELDHTPGIITR